MGKINFIDKLTRQINIICLGSYLENDRGRLHDESQIKKMISTLKNGSKSIDDVINYELPKVKLYLEI